MKAAGFSDAFISTAGAGTVVATSPSKKSVEEVAKEVIAGKWGNGDARKKALTEAGYDYSAVQKRSTPFCLSPAVRFPMCRSGVNHDRSLNNRI